MSQQLSKQEVNNNDEVKLAVWREIQKALKDLSFGSVELVIHNGQVVQVERKEKIRLNHVAY